MTKRFNSQAHKSVNIIRLFIGFALLASTLVLPVGVAEAAETVEPDTPGKMFPESHNVAKRQKYSHSNLDSKISDEKVDCSIEENGKDAGAALYQIIDDNELVKYNPKTGTYGSKTGDKFVIEGVDKTLNGLLIDPDGRVFAAHMKSNNAREFVQILPKSGKFKTLISLTSNTSSYNAGTYIEENGVPYAVLSQGYGKKAIKINLDQIPSSPPEIELGVSKKLSNSKAKDFIWVHEGLVVDNHTYHIVGIYVTGGKLEVYLSDMKGKSTKKTYPGYKDFDGVYGASYNFKSADDMNETTSMFFSNNDTGGMMQLLYENNEFSLVRIGDSDKTSDNDGGGCPFTEAVLGPVKVITADCDFKPDEDNKEFVGTDTYFQIEIKNSSSGSEDFEIYATVDNPEDDIDPKTTSDEDSSEWNWKEVKVGGDTEETFLGKVAWGEKWEVKVRYAPAGKEISFTPSGNTLNEDACDALKPQEDKFEPDVTFVYACSTETPKVPQVTVALNNSVSTVDATFSFIVEGGTDPGLKEVEAGDEESITIDLDEDTEWSITWTANPPEDSGFNTEEEEYVPQTADSPADCEDDPEFDLTFTVKVECNDENKPELVFEFDNSKSNVGGKLEVWIYVNEEPFDGEGFSWPLEDEFSAGDEDSWRPVPLPEDSTWYFDWKLTPEDSGLDSKDGKESQGEKSSYHFPAESDDTDCVDITKCDQSCGDVFGYVWVDSNKDGERTEIDGGDEDHVKGVEVVLSNVSDILNSDGTVHIPKGGYKITVVTGEGPKSGTDESDYRWYIADVPVEDFSGKKIDWEATFDYKNAEWPEDFEPAGYTEKKADSEVINSETDSDVVLGEELLGVSGSFTLNVDEEEHRADAGVIEGDPPVFEPEVTIELLCTYNGFDNPSAKFDITVDNSKSEVEATVTVTDKDDLEVGNFPNVAAGITKDLPFIGEHGQVFKVSVIAAEDAGLHEPIVKSETIDCPRFDVEVELGEIDCNAKPPTVTVIFKNNSDISVSFDYEIFETLVGGGRNTPPIKGSGSGPSVEPGEQEAQQITVDKNWTWLLNWTVEDDDIFSGQEWSDGGKLDTGPASPFVPCPGGFESEAEITVECTDTGPKVTFKVNNFASDMDVEYALWDSRDEGPTEYTREVEAGESIRVSFPGINGLIWYLSVRPEGGILEGVEPVLVQVEVDCYKPELYLLQNCATMELEIVVDNSELDYPTILTVTETRPGATTKEIINTEISPNVEEKSYWPLPVGEAKGTTYSATLTGSDGSSYKPVIDEQVISCSNIEIEPFDCSNHPTLIQILGVSNVGFEVKELNPSSGEYREIYTIPFGKPPKFNGLNAAGINKFDGKAYAMMSTGSSAYLVRFDKNNVHFVAKLPAMSASGDVDKAGNFVWTQNTSKTLNVLPEIKNLPGFEDRSEVPDMSNWTPTLENIQAPTSDITTIVYDFGDGEGSYAMGLWNDLLYMYRYDNPTGDWVIKVKTSDGSASPTDGAFGAAWNYDSRILFAANNGDGVYEVPLDKIDLVNKTAEIQKVAESTETDWNDGMNCADVPVCLPEEFGNVYGYAWVDWEESGDRTEVEGGPEEHLKGVTVTLTLESDYKNSEGDVCDAYGDSSWVVQTDGQSDSDYQWQISDLPAKDNFGNDLSYKARFDYQGADFPEGFDPTGYTKRLEDKVTSSEVDSDVFQNTSSSPTQEIDPMIRRLMMQHKQTKHRNISRVLGSASLLLDDGSPGTTTATSDVFTIEPNETVHRADAGIVGTVEFEPVVEITIDCAIESAAVLLNNQGSSVSTKFVVDVYHEKEAPENKVLDQSGEQLVPAREEATFEKVIPPILGTLKIVVTAYAEHNGILFGPDLVAHNDSGTECDPPFSVTLDALVKCPALELTITNYSSEQLNLDPLPAAGPVSIEVTLYQDGFPQSLGNVVSDSLSPYYDLDAGNFLVEKIPIQEGSLWFIEYKVTDLTYPQRTIEGTIIGSGPFDCVDEEPPNPEVTFVPDCATGTGVFTINNSDSLWNIDFTIKELGEIIRGPETVNAKVIKEIELLLDHNDKFTVELTLSEDQPDVETFRQLADNETIQEPSQITRQTFNTGLQNPVSLVQVVVESGDTLSEIAAEYGIKTSELMAANGIEDASRIYIGQKLQVPNKVNPQISPLVEFSASPQTSVDFVEVVIKWGDTLSEIAAEHGIKTSELMAANGIEDASRIYIGQKLTISKTQQGPDWEVISQLVETLEKDKNNVLFAEGENTTVEVEYAGEMFEFEVDCPVFEPEIDFNEYCGDESLHISVSNEDSDIAGEIFIYENGELVSEGAVLPGREFKVDYPFTFGATYEVTVNPVGSSNGFTYDPVNGEHEIGCDEPFEPSVETSVECSNYGPEVTLELINKDSHLSAEFMFTLIIDDNPDVIEIGPISVGARSDKELVLTSELGVPRSALEDATWRFEWTATVPENENLEVTGTTPSETTDCLSPVGPFDCASNLAPLQVVLADSGIGYELNTLNLATGSLQDIYTIPFNRTSPSYSEINGIGLDPSEEKIYGFVRIKEDNVSSSYMIRFDSQQIEYLAQVTNFPNSATFDNQGNFLWMSEGSLYKAENAKDIKGYVDHQDLRVPDLRNDPPVYDARDEGDVYGHAVDIAHVQADIGLGVTDYIVGMVYGADQVVLIGYEGADLDRRLLDSVDNTGSKANLPGGGYGSAWSIGGQVFIAANSGEVFQIALDDAEVNPYPFDGSVEIRRVGSSAVSAHNDGTNCPGVPVCFPEIFGDAYGYVWIDWDVSKDRTAIEHGMEEHVAGVNVTLTNSSPFYDSEGEPCYQPGELEISSTYTGQGSSAGDESGNYRWWIDDLPAEDNSGNRIKYKATFDYAGGQFPQGFTPTGYTVKQQDDVFSSPTDSDVSSQNFTKSLNTQAVSGEFTIEPQMNTHTADAGVVGEPVFAPTATVDVDCDADTANIELDNSGSTVQAKYEVSVYHGDVEENNLVQSQSGDKTVDAGDVVDYGKRIPPPRGQILTILITATPQKDDLDLGFEPVTVWNQAGVNCPTGFVVQIQVETDCDSGGVKVTLDNSESSVDALFTLMLNMGAETEMDSHEVVEGEKEEVLISVTEDSEWTLTWKAVETGQSEDEEGFVGIIGPEQFDCEPEEFLPVVSVDHVCDILGDTATFSIDNTDSGVDAIVEVYSDDELIWGPTIVEKGTESYETTIPVTGIEAITIRVAAEENSHNYGTTTIKETLNCPETQVAPFDCASFPALIQIVGTTNVGFEVKELNPASGEYRPIYSIPFNRTPSFTGMNAAGINKVDSTAYALMSLNPTSPYLIRFDAQEVLFVAKMPEFSAAGDVDEAGNFVWIKNTNKTLSVLPDIANMEGFKDPADAPDMSDWGPELESVQAPASDIATMIYDFGDGEGDYAMGLVGNNLYVYRYDDPLQAWIIKVTIPGVSNSPKPEGAFGAAWSHEDRIYFASNKGLGVYEVMVPTIDFESKTAEIRKVANSDATAWNDGMNCTGIPTCLPDIFGSTYGYSWVDWEESGDRTNIENGTEEHIAGVKVTLTNTTAYHDSEGNECYGPGEFVLETSTGANDELSGQDNGDYRWYLSDVPVEDSFGMEMRYEIHFDYEEAIFPEGFTPLGYTQQLNNELLESELDSDARPVQTTFFSTTKAVSEDFSLVAGQEVHRPDAGIVGELEFDPTATVEIDCSVELAQVELDNSESEIDALYTVDVYHGEIKEENKIVEQSGTQSVESGDIDYYATAIPPPTGELLTVIVNAEAVRDGLELEYEKDPVWNQAGTDCPSDFVAQVQVETDCDIGGAKVTLGNPGTDTGAIFEIALVVEGIKSTTEHELDADDTYIIDLAIEDDSEWFIEWQAKEISEEEFRFSASTTPRTIDCEEPQFTPIISTGFTCTTVGGVITVFVDNRISEIDSIVEIEINTELSWGPETINAGDISNVITIPAVDGDFVRVWVNSAEESITTAAVMAEETVDCPVFDPEADVDVDCEIDRALITLDNFKSSVEALFEIKVYRGDVDPANYVLEESGIQLVGPESSSIFMKPIPLSGDQVLSIEVIADAMRDGEPLGLEPKIVWSQSVSDCPSGFSAQIKVEVDCDLGGIVVTMDAKESEIPVIFSIVGVIDEVPEELNSYEIMPGDTTQTVIPVNGNSDWNVEWSATNTENTEQTFAASTPVQEIDCDVEELIPDPENPFNPDANVNVECRIDRALIKLDNQESTVDALFRVDVYRNGIKSADVFYEESGVLLLEAGLTASYMPPISLVNRDLLSIVVTAEAIRDGKFIELEPVVIWEQSFTDCLNGFVGQVTAKHECDLGGIEVTLDAKGSSIPVLFNTTTVVDGVEQTFETFEVTAGKKLLANFALPNGSEWRLKWSVENPENSSEILKQGSTKPQIFSCEEEIVVTTTSTIPQVPEEEEITEESLILPPSKEEVCEECCWPWWLFLLLGIAALLGSLGMIALLGLALAALGGKKSGGCCTKDEGLPGAPLNLVINEKDNSFKLSWEKAENGNLPTGYLIEGRIGNDWVDIVTVIGRERWVAIRKSEADAVNAWRVSAANENGRGRASEEIFTS